jgi:phosphatidylinositol 4-kinase
MDCLELNIHQRILSDIASKEPEIDSPSVKSLSSRALTRSGFSDEPGNVTERIYMSATRAHCNIAFGDLVMHFPDPQISTSIETLMPVLVGMLKDVPFIDFDKSLSWTDWALPDQLVFSIISALLRVTNEHPGCSEEATSAIFSFVSQTIDQIESSTSLDVLTQLMPSLHGFYRAISSTAYSWTLEQWRTLTLLLQRLCSSDIIDRLNHLLVDILQKEQLEADTLRHVQTFVTRYVSQGRPLSGYFMVCCVLETEWTVLAQVLAPPTSTKGPVIEAAAANRAWHSLTRNAAQELDIDNEDTRVVLKDTIKYAMQCFTDLLVQIEDMDSEPSLDTYAWETVSESLKLASICSLALRDLDEQLYNRILLLLSMESPISDNLTQEAALKATTVLVRRFVVWSFQLQLLLTYIQLPRNSLEHG